MTINGKLRIVALAVAVTVVSFAKSHAQETIFAVTDNQFLVSWQSNSPNNLTSGVALSGLQQNEQILGIDFRPLDNQIFAIGSSNRLYTLNSTTGAATQVGASFSIPLDGSAFGYDFNPTIDRSRVVSNTNNNYVVDPTGLITQVTDVFYAAGDVNQGNDPNIVHLGYTNSFAGATTTQLYAIDSGLDILATQANSAGTLNTVGSLGININELGGFDISGTTGIAYAALRPSGLSDSQFYTINLSTGAATLVGEIGGGAVITALTVQAQAIPEPASALAFVGLAAGVLLRRRR